MQYFYHYIFLIIWVAYFVYWKTISGNVKSAARTEPFLSRTIRAIAIILAILLLAIPQLPIPLISLRFLPVGELFFWIGLLITISGLGFSVWARSKLGRNWSQEVTIKDDHQLITDGPYALVRHPIYTGLIFGFIGSSIALGEIRGLISDLLVFAVLLYKLKLEDKWLMEQFGDPYKRYCKKVAALIPFVI